MKDLYTLTVVVMAIVSAGCSSTGKTIFTEIHVIENAGKKPAWVEKNKIQWIEDDMHYFSGTIRLRGDERVSGGYMIASMDNREQLMRSVADEIRGQLDEAQISLNENAEILLGKVRSGTWEGTIYGLQDLERYYDRFEMCTGQDCRQGINVWILSGISMEDYRRTKDALVNKLVQVDPRVKDAITRGQVDFFSRGKATTGKDKETTSEQTPNMGN